MKPRYNQTKEVYSTGFPQSDKQNLICLSQQNSYVVRIKVTKHLDILVCGPNADGMKNCTSVSNRLHPNE